MKETTTGLVYIYWAGRGRGSGRIEKFISSMIIELSWFNDSDQTQIRTLWAPRNPVSVHQGIIAHTQQ